MFYFKNARNNSCEKFGKSTKLNFEITILFVFEMNNFLEKMFIDYSKSLFH